MSTRADKHGQLLTDDAAMHTIATMEEHSRRTHELTAALYEWIDRANTPADYQVHTADALTPKKTIFTKQGPALSVGVINPMAIPVYLGIGGAPATATGRAFPVPGNGGVVLPVTVEDFEIGVDPADVATLAGSTGVYYVLLFKTVQPFAIWGAV